MKTNEEYRWNSPQEWLLEQVYENARDDAAYLRGVISSLLEKLDADDVQDIFQAEMVSDGYFKTIAELEEEEEEEE